MVWDVIPSPCRSAIIYHARTHHSIPHANYTTSLQLASSSTLTGYHTNITSKYHILDYLTITLYFVFIINLEWVWYWDLYVRMGLGCGWWDARSFQVNNHRTMSESGRIRRRKTCCCGGCPPMGWALVAGGVLLVVTAFLLGVTYFSIRTLTTSLQHVETIPAYAIALLVSLAYIILGNPHQITNIYSIY